MSTIVTLPAPGAQPILPQVAPIAPAPAAPGLPFMPAPPAGTTSPGRRMLRLTPPEYHPFLTSDGVALLLTRYRGGSKGPIILAPGFGTSTRAFVIDSVDTNLTEYLFAQGYDVWLLDYRASPALPSAQTQFTLDHIALLDYPAAVDTVVAATGADSVQFLGHCVASGTLFMALLAGVIPRVRSAICSQFMPFVLQPASNRLKARSGLAWGLEDMGEKTITTAFGGGLAERVMNEVLAHYPGGEHCDRPVCRRILFFYGEVFKHEQLNAATHDDIPTMFGIGNLTGFEHLSLMIRRQRLVDHHGHDSYLPRVEGMSTPISLLQGAQNRIFLQRGAELTYEWLCNNNDPALYALRVVENYKHMDCFIGESAAWDIFPMIAADLDRYN